MKDPQKSKNFGYAELEKEYGIKRNTAYSLVAQNRIPHIRLGNRFVLFERDAIEAHFAAHRVATPKPGEGSKEAEDDDT